MRPSLSWQTSSGTASPSVVPTGLGRDRAFEPSDKSLGYYQLVPPGHFLPLTLGAVLLKNVVGCCIFRWFREQELQESAKLELGRKGVT